MGRALPGLLATAAALAILPAAHAAPLAAPPDIVEDPSITAYLSPDERRERAERIRDAAAGAGVTNGVLIAGIGQAETGLAHCWSEATWACQGPPSASCDGGPVIAGAADGPCSAQQGGLGMFQFDAGTYSDTISAYGEDIVTIEGNVAAVVPFLAERAIQSVDGVETTEQALAWMNSIPIEPGNQLFEDWLYFVAWRYNGCMGCTGKINTYRDATVEVYEEFGPDFWASPGSQEDGCAAIPANGRVVEENDACYESGGDPQYWRTAEAGHGGRLQWTQTVDSDRDDNYGVWTLRFESSGRYEIEVYTDGGEYGESESARYQVTHAGGTDERVVDQSAARGWQSLGSFEFAGGDADQSVRLGDNTGEPWQAEPDGTRLMFDAVRVRPAGAAGDGDEIGPDPDAGDLGGGLCSASGGAGGAPLWLLAALALVWRRRRQS